MASTAAMAQEPAPIIACTVSRDVQLFDLLIEDMEEELGESWGDLSFEDAETFLTQPEADDLEFLAIAVDENDENRLTDVGDLIKGAKAHNIKVILIADELSPMALHQLLRLGADDFVPYPLPEGALKESIERVRTPDPEPVAPIVQVVDNTQLKPAGTKKDGAIFPVHGLAGGVGASTFAVNLAWELANVSDGKKRKKKEKSTAPRVCLIDLDLQFGSASTFLDLPRKEAVYELLADTASMDSESFMQALQVFDDKLHVLTAPADMLPLDLLGPDDVTVLLETAKANFDFVIVDMPKTLVQWTETVLTQSDIYFAALELDMRSAQNALRMIRALKSEDLPHEKLRFVLNRAPGFTDLAGKGRVKRMAENLEIEIDILLPDGGKQVPQTGDHGLPLAENAAKNPLRKEIAKLAASLVEHSQAEAVAD